MTARPTVAQRVYRGSLGHLSGPLDEVIAWLKVMRAQVPRAYRASATIEITNHGYDLDATISFHRPMTEAEIAEAEARLTAGRADEPRSAA